MSFGKQHVCCFERGQKCQSKPRCLFVSTLASKCTYNTGMFCALEAISKIKSGPHFARCLFFSAFKCPQYLPEFCARTIYVRYFMSAAAARDQKKRRLSPECLFLLWLQTSIPTLHVLCSQIKNEADTCLLSVVGNKYMLRNLMTLGLCSTYIWCAKSIASFT